MTRTARPVRADPRSVPATMLRWLVALATCAAIAHGCHTGDHGDADLLSRFVTGAGSPPAAASP